MKEYYKVQFGLPCSLIRISFLVSRDSQLPYLNEVLIRYAKILGSPTIDDLRQLLHLNEDELSHLINSMLNAGIIEAAGEEIKLTQYGNSLFNVDEKRPVISKIEDIQEVEFSYNNINLEHVFFHENKNEISTELKADINKYSRLLVQEAFQRCFNSNDKKILKKLKLEASDLLIGVNKSRLVKYFNSPIPVSYSIDTETDELEVFENASSLTEYKKGSDFIIKLRESIKHTRESLMPGFDASFNIKPVSFLNDLLPGEVERITHDNRLRSSFLETLPRSNNADYSIYFGAAIDLEHEIRSEILNKGKIRLDNAFLWSIPTLPFIGCQPMFALFYAYLQEQWTSRLTPIINTKNYKKYTQIYLERKLVHYGENDLDFVEILSLYDQIGVFVLYFYVDKNFPLMPITFVLHDEKLKKKLYDYLDGELNKKSKKAMEALGNFEIPLTRRLKIMFPKLVFK